MDQKTIAVYDENADSFVADWMSQTPAMIRALILKYFSAPAYVVDIGSGSGRDVSWLIEQGFIAEGLDASVGLLTSAKSRYPKASFRYDSLPHLENSPSSSYDYALCSAVLMHLPKHELTTAVKNILRLIKPGGIVIASVRPSRQEREREGDGRLYTELSLSELSVFFSAHSCNVLEQMTTVAGESDRTWLTIVAQKL